MANRNKPVTSGGRTIPNDCAGIYFNDYKMVTVLSEQPDEENASSINILAAAISWMVKNDNDLLHQGVTEYLKVMALIKPEEFEK